jgi:hypothetical protein
MSFWFLFCFFYQLSSLPRLSLCLVRLHLLSSLLVSLSLSLGKNGRLPQPVVQIVHVLDPDSLVHRLDIRRRERRHPDSHRVLVALGVNSHGVLLTDFVVDRRAGRGQPRAHDVRPGEHKLDRSFIGSELGHHVGVLMEQPQSRQPGPVALAEKERGLVDDKDLDVIGAVWSVFQRRQRGA